MNNGKNKKSQGKSLETAASPVLLVRLHFWSDVGSIYVLTDNVSKTKLFMENVYDGKFDCAIATNQDQKVDKEKDLQFLFNENSILQNQI